ncbi:MAG: hypothetical protein E7214_02845 [Clostridium sp.]|nr:hypothetical protein [Clostridium sp.]
MNSVLIMNLGSHDIKIKKDKLDELKEIFKEDNEMLEILINDTYKDGEDLAINKNSSIFSKKINDNFDKVKDCITFPIVKSVIDNIRNGLDEEEMLKKIIFVCTEQDHNKDTSNLGDLLKKVKQSKSAKLIGFSNDRAEKKFKGGIKTQKYIINQNPSDYDLMINEYKKILINEKNNDKIYLSVTAGTPAMSSALIYNATKITECEVVPLYLNKNDNLICKFKISDKIRKDSIKKQIISFIKVQDYKAAEIITKHSLSKYCKDIDNLEVITKFLQAAQARIEFNFESATKLVEDIYSYADGSRKISGIFIKYIRNIKSDERMYLINELKNNAVYKYNTGAYADFLGRIFRLNEDIYRYILERNNLLKNIDRAVLDESKLSENQIAKLNNIKIESDNLRYLDTTLSIDAMYEILNVFLKENSQEEVLIKKCYKLNKLKKLRNKSILAHGYEGVSKKNIDDCIGIEDLSNIVKNLEDTYNIEVCYDDFYNLKGDFNKHIINLIDKL